MLQEWFLRWAIEWIFFHVISKHGLILLTTRREGQLSFAFPGVPHNIEHRIAGLRADIWTRDIPNTKHGC
jgi:hypothetical protein